jgi:DNA-binding transcriptional ArsR family regulator
MSSDDEFGSRRGFEILSDETRISILRILADRLRDRPEDPTVGFSDLRRAVGMRDSGNFNYHLDQLTGRFVLEADEGYRIAPAGIEVVAALVAGVYGEGERLGPVELDDPCPVCDEPLTAVYENSLLTVTCPDEHEFRNTLPPGAIDGRSIEDVIELLTLTSKQHMELAVNGICPFCQGRLDWSISSDRERELTEFSDQCDRCGVRIEVPAVACLLRHPAVVSFYHDHGVDVRDRPLWAPEFYDGVRASVSDDPIRIDVSIDLDGDELGAILDGDLSVIEVTV